MSRFLFATIGSLGDLHPYIAIGRELIARGHEAVIVSAEEYRAVVQKAGVEFSPARPSLAALGDYQKAVERIFDVRRGAERLIREMIMPTLRLSYEDIMRASPRADLLVSHPLTLAVRLIAERESLPWVATVLSPMSFMSHFDPPVIAAAPWLRNLRRLGPSVYGLVFQPFKRIVWGWERPLRDFRKELGLTPLKQLAMFEGQFSPLLNLALFDPQLARPQPDWPQKTSVCGAPVFAGAKENAADLQDLYHFVAQGAAPIVFALGSSAVWVAKDFWEHAATAAREMGRRAILITGPQTPSLLSEELKTFSYLPYSKVFPLAAVVVHQAGIGTLAQALRAGRPQLMLPLAFDQPDNARRAEGLGLGRVIPFSKATPRLLASELRSLLSQPIYAERASIVAEGLAKVNGAARAADLLVQCLSWH